MIYGQLGLTIGHNLWASWGQAGPQGVAMIYGPALWVGCHHKICSSLGIGVAIVVGQARVLVSP